MNRIYYFFFNLLDPPTGHLLKINLWITSLNTSTNEYHIKFQNKIYIMNIISDEWNIKHGGNISQAGLKMLTDGWIHNYPNDTFYKVFSRNKINNEKNIVVTMHAEGHLYNKSKSASCLKISTSKISKWNNIFK